MLVAVRGPGELVGELTALAGSDPPRAASVVALDDVVVQAIPSADFLRFVEGHPALSFGLLRQLAARVREATGAALRRGRLRRAPSGSQGAVDEADRDGHVVEGGTAVGAGLSQDDLAGLVAASSSPSVLRWRAAVPRPRLHRTSFDRHQRCRRSSPLRPLIAHPAG